MANISQVFMCSLVMSVAAVGKQVALELARGVSTALTISVAAPRCPDCACQPVINLPETKSCPDCVCDGSHRSCPACATCKGVAWSLFALIWVLGFLTGIAVVVWFHRDSQTGVRVEAQPIEESPPLKENLAGPKISAAAVALAKRKSQ